MRRTATSVAKLLARQGPVVIGHRGYCQVAPENTLPSFELATVAGVDLVELDCHQSRDGVLMAIHDADLDRTTDSQRSLKRRHIGISSMNASAIQELDAGSWFDSKYAGVRVPTLEEALELIRKNSIALIERKTGDARVLVELLRRKRLVHNVIVQSFDWKFLHLVHLLLPELAIGALGPAKVLADGRKATRIFRRLTKSWLRASERTGAKVIVWSQQVSPKAVRLAHKQGLKVWVYTVNEEKQARRLLRAGVDGLISNNPPLIWRTIALMRA